MEEQSDDFSFPKEGNGRSNLHSVHGHHHHHRGHVHEHRGHVHEHHGHVHDHHGNKHDHHANQFDHHGRGYDNYSHIHSQRTHRHHHGNDIHNALGHSGTHPHHQHGYQTAETTHTPCNSPHRPSRHSLTQQGHYSPATSSYDPMYPGYHSHARVPEHHRTNQHHSEARRFTDARSQSQGGLRTGVQDHQNGDTRRRDHELHWDRHQVYKLRGMITDPHYKEQLELEGGKVYPWSSQYPSNKASDNDIENLKNCRYLRFSKLNLENMKENPEKEVEVFERRESPS